MAGIPTLLICVTRDSRTLHRLAFKQPQVRVGREPGSDITLASKDVSRNQCLFELSEGRVYVQDLVSRNGTLLNGERVARAEVQSGDNVQVGEFKLWINVLASSADAMNEAAGLVDGPTLERASPSSRGPERPESS